MISFVYHIFQSCEFQSPIISRTAEKMHSLETSYDLVKNIFLKALFNAKSVTYPMYCTSFQSITQTR